MPKSSIDQLAYQTIKSKKNAEISVVSPSTTNIKILRIMRPKGKKGPNIQFI